MAIYGSFESSQYAEVISGDESKEVEFQFTIDCTSLGRPAYISGPPEGCYPAEAAEFELDSIHVQVDEGNPVPISYQILEAVVGKEMAQAMLSDAETEAMESGDF